MGGVVEVADVDGPDGDANEGDDFGQLFPEFVELLLKGSLVRLRGHHLVADLEGDRAKNFTKFCINYMQLPETELKNRLKFN